MVKKLTLVFASLGLAACVANDPPTSSSSAQQQSSSSEQSSEVSSSSVTAISSSSSQAQMVSSSQSSLPTQSSSSQSSIPATATAGKALYEMYCLECHGVVGAGSIKIPVPIKDASFDSIMAKVDGGNMPTGTGPSSMRSNSAACS